MRWFLNDCCNAVLLICLLRLSNCFDTINNIKNIDNINIDNNNDDTNKELKPFTFYKKIKDPLYECPQPTTETVEGPEIFVNVDCDEVNARWDYNYKVK